MSHAPKSPTAEPAPTSGLVLAGERAADVVAFEEQVVEFFMTAADLLGVPKSVAAIYGIVFASPVPLSFADIEVRLNISKGSISQGLRLLREVGAVKEYKGEGTRGEGREARGEGGKAMGEGRGAMGEESGARRFVPDLELRKLVARFLENRLEKQLDAGGSRLTTLVRAIPGRGDDAAELKRRLDSLSDWHRKTRLLLPLARAVLKLET